MKCTIVKKMSVPTILQVRYGEAVWPLVVRTIGIGVAGAGGGAAVGAAVGAGIGALVGALGRPVGVESGAGIGAAIGAAVGGAGGGGSATAVAGYIGFNCIKDVRNFSELIDKASTADEGSPLNPIHDHKCPSNSLHCT